MAVLFILASTSLSRLAELICWVAQGQVLMVRPKQNLSSVVVMTSTRSECSGHICPFACTNAPMQHHVLQRHRTLAGWEAHWCLKCSMTLLGLLGVCHGMSRVHGGNACNVLFVYSREGDFHVSAKCTNMHTCIVAGNRWEWLSCISQQLEIKRSQSCLSSRLWGRLSNTLIVTVTAQLEENLSPFSGALGCSANSGRIPRC